VNGRIGSHDPPRFPSNLCRFYGRRLLPFCCPVPADLTRSMSSGDLLIRQVMPTSRLSVAQEPSLAPSSRLGQVPWVAACARVGTRMAAGRPGRAAAAGRRGCGVGRAGRGPGPSHRRLGAVVEPASRLPAPPSLLGSSPGTANWGEAGLGWPTARWASRRCAGGSSVTPSMRDLYRALVYRDNRYGHCHWRLAPVPRS
jgi:hypothetical protein